MHITMQESCKIAQLSYYPHFTYLSDPGAQMDLKDGVLKVTLLKKNTTSEQG